MSHPSDDSKVSVTLEEEINNEDGTVSLRFQTSEEAEQACIVLGLKLLLYLAAIGMSTEELFEMLEQRLDG